MGTSPSLDWSDIVDEYSGLSLSYHTDRLPALSGIAKSLNVFKRGRYVAGLWENDLPRSLCWIARQPSHRRLESSPYPSWSWASISTPVLTDHVAKSFSKSSDLTIHEVQCSFASDDPHGEVRGGRLVVSGSLTAAKCVQVRGGDGGLSYHELEEIRVSNFHREAIELNGYILTCYWDGDRQEVGQDVFCLQMGVATKRVYLVLWPVNWHFQTFRRVGLIEADYNNMRDGRFLYFNSRTPPLYAPYQRDSFGDMLPRYDIRIPDRRETEYSYSYPDGQPIAPKVWGGEVVGPIRKITLI
jgi:hypothetical protein